MRKIGFVIPWYGEDIPGGAEMELREVATHLQRAGMDVEILTTCVREFSADWNENYYSAGTAVVEDIAVRRFPVRRRDTAAFDRVNRRLMEGQHLSLQEEKTFVEEMVNSPQLLIDTHLVGELFFRFHNMILPSAQMKKYGGRYSFRIAKTEAF